MNKPKRKVQLKHRRKRNNRKEKVRKSLLNRKK